MKINDVGYNIAHENDFIINRPNGSGDYVLLLLRSKSVFIMGEREIEAPPQSFFLYRKGTPQIYRADGDIFVNDWIHFDMSPEEEKKTEDMGIPFDTIVPCGEIAVLSDIIKSMYQEKYSVNIYKEKSLSLYLELLIVKIAEQLKALSSPILFPYYEKMATLRAKIYNDPCNDWSVKQMARDISLSESYFQHLYKRIFGVSVFGDVISARIKRAQYLLFSTDHSISRICDECGYKNDVHFMRQFKKETGYTPSEYRKRHSFFLSHKAQKILQKNKIQ